VLALLDARLGRKITGIGYYTVEIAAELGTLAPTEVVPIVSRGHRGRFERMGLQPWVSPKRRGELDVNQLPDADVIHGPNFHALPHPSAQRVATFHDLGYLRLPECHPPGMPERLDAIVRGSLEHTAVFLCDSESAKDDFVSTYGVEESRCTVVYPGVAPRFLDAGAKPAERLPAWWRLRPPYLLHVGAMIRRKDLRTLVEAFGLARRERPDLQLVLAGNKTRRWASDWPNVREWMKANPADAKHVRVLNYVPDRHMVQLYRNAAACVSATRWEGFGMTVLEAMAAGRPVVTSNVGSIPEVGGDVVHYGEPRQPETYARAILAALEQPDDSPRAAEGRRRAAEFTWRRSAELTLDAYRSAAGRLAIG
jgi:glycosyltransferase involved in cell wall biosynthesis